MHRVSSFNLERFIVAQSPQYREVLTELQAGRKVGHWMWYIFPQVVGLGYSRMSRDFGITCLEEAVEYLSHPILGVRLNECTELVMNCGANGIMDVFPNVDCLKFRSCMTLFSITTYGRGVFTDALSVWFDGEEDEETLRILKIR